MKVKKFFKWVTIFIVGYIAILCMPIQSVALAQETETKLEPVSRSTYILPRTNLRESPNGTIINYLASPLWVEGVWEGDWLKFSYLGKETYVYRSRLSDNLQQYTGYVVEQINIRDTTTNRVIGSLHNFDQVTGILSGDWVYFKYQGQAAKAYAPLLSTNPNIEAYILKGTNIRKSPNGKIIGYTENPKYIRGTIEDNWVFFVEEGQAKYVHKSCISKYGVNYSGYLEGQTNIRQTPNGTLLGREKSGYLIQGTLEKNWVRFTYKGKTAYVYERLLSSKRTITDRYIYRGVNIRTSPNGRQTGQTNRVYYVRGYLSGDWFEFTENGVKRYVYTDLTSASPPAGQSNVIVMPGSNIRRASDHGVFRKTSVYEQLTGKLNKHYFEYKENGVKYYVHDSVLIPNDHSVTGWLRKNQYNYYLDANGNYYTKSIRKIGGRYFKFNSSGVASEWTGYNYTTLLSVPWSSQLTPAYAPNGCEMASALGALKYKGVAPEGGLVTLLEEMPRNNNARKGFTSNPYSFNLGTIYPEAMLPTIQKYAPDSADTTGAGIAGWKKELEQGNPIVLWCTSQYFEPYWGNLGFPSNIHVQLIVGYSDYHQTFTVMDPWSWSSDSAYKWVNQNQLYRSANYKNRMSLTIR